MEPIWVYKHSSLCCLRFSRAKVKKCRPPKSWKWEQHVWMDSDDRDLHDPGPVVVEMWRQKHSLITAVKHVFGLDEELIKQSLHQPFPEVCSFDSVFWFMRSDKWAKKSQHHPKVSYDICFNSFVYYWSTENHEGCTEHLHLPTEDLSDISILFCFFFPN